MSLEKGMIAPDFTTTDQNGKTVRLSDFLGKKVILYFYPKDDTPDVRRKLAISETITRSWKTRVLSF